MRRVLGAHAAAVSGLLLAIVMGNLAILGAVAWARDAEPAHRVISRPGIENFQHVDDRVWRGAAPSIAGYEGLARDGVRTVVDLRAEDDLRQDDERLQSLGVRLVRIPMRDGQVPTSDQVARFLDAIATSDGTVFVHCGAGVGRTGTMAAAYLAESGQVGASEALRRNLAVGPPSLEQVAFASGLDAPVMRSPVVAVSRALDAPRRAWVRLRS